MPLLRLAALLSLLLVSFWFFLPSLSKSLFWPVFAIIATAWFGLQYGKGRRDKESLKKALKIGILLVAASVLVNYVFGYLIGAYIIEPSYSLFFVLGNPVELLVASLLGGTGWFLYVPKRFDKIYSILDILMLGFFGMMTEIMLIANGLLTYVTVDSLNAFLTYAMLWAVLHLVYYKLLK